MPLFALGFCLSSPAWAQTAYPFKGLFDRKLKLFSVTFQVSENSFLNLGVKKRDEHSYAFSLDAKDLRVLIFDITSTIEGKTFITTGPAGQPVVTLRAQSTSSIINGQHVPQFFVQARLSDHQLIVDRINFGDTHIAGVVRLFEPYDVNLLVSLDHVRIDAMLEWLNAVTGKNYVGTGQISGTIRLAGTWDRLTVNADLESDQGYIENLHFDRMVFHLDGVYPILTVADSLFTQRGGMSLGVSGTLSLGDLQSLPEQLRGLKKAPLVYNDSEQSEWIIKKIPAGEEAAEGEFKYFLRKEGSINPTINDELDFFGVERKIGF